MRKTAVLWILAMLLTCATFAEDGGYVPPPHCQTFVARDVAWRDSCARHLALEQREAALTQSCEAVGYAEAGTLWLKEVETLFDACVAEAPADQKQAWADAWEAWQIAFASQRGAMAAAWPSDPEQVERQSMLMMRLFAEELCEIRSGELPADADMGYQEPEEMDFAEDFCQLWSEETGTLSLLPCGEHAALLNGEYELTWSDAPDAHAWEDLAGGWDQSLFALYEEWAAMCDEETAEAVKYARADFFRAQTALGMALAPYGVDDMARMRVAQMECGRLCELLRYIQMAG